MEEEEVAMVGAREKSTRKKDIEEGKECLGQEKEQTRKKLLL